MGKVRKYIKIEVEVEIFACAHITAMIFFYGLLEWLMYGGSVPFPILVGQMALGYVISWLQKGLFFQEKHYSDLSYKIREILWCLLPGCLVVAAGDLGNGSPIRHGGWRCGFMG